MTALLEKQTWVITGNFSTRADADLAGEAGISPAHLSEAIQYRAKDGYY